MTTKQEKLIENYVRSKVRSMLNEEDVLRPNQIKVNSVIRCKFDKSKPGREGNPKTEYIGRVTKIDGREIYAELEGNQNAKLDFFTNQVKTLIL